MVTGAVRSVGQWAVFWGPVISNTNDVSVVW